MICVIGFTSQRRRYASSARLNEITKPIAMATTVGLATLAFFAGAGGLGEQIFADINFKSNVVTAGGLAVALAAVLDGAILLTQRAITPWTRAAASR